MDPHIECRSLNPRWLRYATRDVADTLEHAGIEHEFTEFDGGHSLSAERFGKYLVRRRGRKGGHGSENPFGNVFHTEITHAGNRNTGAVPFD